MEQIPPRVFISYSHDSQLHKDWVLNIATRLVANGVDVILDQWDLSLGSNLPKFIENGLTEADRILAVCTENYVSKANQIEGGVGYEKMILTAQLFEDLSTDLIVPVVCSPSASKLVPTFLNGRVYIDFRDELAYEENYAKLLRDIHNEPVSPRPPLGPNPYREKPKFSAPLISFGPERYVSPALSGKITFDYSNNNGRFVLGAGEMAFETAWSRGGNTAIHALNDPPSIRSVAIAIDTKNIKEILDTSVYDTSSRVRSPQLGEVVVWQNSAGYYLATKIEKIQSRSHGCQSDEVVFTYEINSMKKATFAE